MNSSVRDQNARPARQPSRTTPWVESDHITAAAPEATEAITSITPGRVTADPAGLVPVTAAQLDAHQVETAPGRVTADPAALVPVIAAQLDAHQAETAPGRVTADPARLVPVTTAQLDAHQVETAPGRVTADRAELAPEARADQPYPGHLPAAARAELGRTHEPRRRQQGPGAREHTARAAHDQLLTANGGSDGPPAHAPLALVRPSSRARTPVTC